MISDITNMSSTLGCGNLIHKADLVKKPKNHVSLPQLQFQLTHYSLCFKRPRYLLKLPVTKTHAYLPPIINFHMIAEEINDSSKQLLL